MPLKARLPNLEVSRMNPHPASVKAVITILCRNKDLHGVLSSLSSFEPLINSKLQYPYVFLNNQDFSPEFKEAVINYVSKFRPNPQIKFSIIPKEHWDYPEFINKTLAKESLVKNAQKYIYGGLESYRFMIRYFSGPFFHHPDLLEYDYYWRVEPDVDFHCEIQYDPFVFMQQKKIKYGFNIFIKELMATVPTLYSSVSSFRTSRNITAGSLIKTMEQQDCGGGYVGSGVCADKSCCSIHGWCGKSKDHCGPEVCVHNCLFPKNQRKDVVFQKKMEIYTASEREALGFCGGGKQGNGTCETKGECCSKWGFCGRGPEYCGDFTCIGDCDGKPEAKAYNGNHFWSNFEIADFRFFRSKQYTDYFDHLDRAGGFFYERWGDAPVHSIAVGLFLQPNEVHYFGDIGYRHAERTMCPKFQDGCGVKCNCNIKAMGTNSIDAWLRFGKDASQKFKD